MNIIALVSDHYQHHHLSILHLHHTIYLHEESERFSGEAGRDCDTEMRGRWWEGGGPRGDPPYWLPCQLIASAWMCKPQERQRYGNILYLFPCQWSALHRFLIHLLCNGWQCLAHITPAGTVSGHRGGAMYKLQWINPVLMEPSFLAKNPPFFCLSAAP